jgi:hypothetical protein
MTTPDTPPPAQPSPAQNRSNTPWIVAGLLVLAAGVGVACFFIGKSSADTSTKESEAAAAVRAEYDPGQPAYEAIYEKGKRKGEKIGETKGQAAGEQQGKQVGLEEGTKQGQAQGDATGVKNGATAALGGFSSWDTNALYVVTVDQGQDNVPYALTSRQQMQEDVGYRLCADDPQNLCQIQIPNPGG